MSHQGTITSASAKGAAGSMAMRLPIGRPQSGKDAIHPEKGPMNIRKNAPRPATEHWRLTRERAALTTR
jgi:hypothetical protein